MAEYTIKDLTAVSGTSERAIRQLFNTNAELKGLVIDHRKKELNRVSYDEVIYNWFVAHYPDKNKPLVDNAVVGGQKENTDPATPQTNPPLYDDKARTEDDLRETIKSLEAQLEEYRRSLEIKASEVDTIAQARDSLLEANQALQSKFEAQEARIEEQARDIESKQAQIERLIVSNNALSATVYRDQTERLLLTQAQKPRLLDRIKRLLTGKKTDTNTERATEIIESVEEEKTD